MVACWGFGHVALWVPTTIVVAAAAGGDTARPEAKSRASAPILRSDLKMDLVEAILLLLRRSLCLLPPPLPPATPSTGGGREEKDTAGLGALLSAGEFWTAGDSRTGTSPLSGAQAEQRKQDPGRPERDE
jgi:hypothetical protein